MARRCPGCGKIHSRKICPHCLYTPFQEEEFRVPGSREWGEIREAPPPRDPRRVSTLPQWQKRTAPQRRAYTRRKGKAVSGLVVFIMLLSMLPAILGAAFSILENAISDITYSHSERETVPSRLTLPENGLTLCDEGGLTLVLDWPGGPIEGDLRVLAQNESGMDLIASTDGVAINGCMVPDAFFYCDVRDQGLTEANFWIDMDSLSHTYGITEIHSLQLTLDIYDSRDFNEFLPQQQITISPSGELDHREPLPQNGREIYSRDGIRLTYQGMEETDRGTWKFYLLAENETAETLNLYSSEVLLNEEGTDYYMVGKFFPGTWGYLELEIYDTETIAKDAGLLSTMEFSLEGSFGEDDSRGFTTDSILVSLK